MVSKKSPLAMIKEKFQGKEKLVEKLLGSAKPVEGESKDGLKKRLLSTSNKKLMKLEERFRK